jgi:hypothetical protein
VTDREALLRIRDLILDIEIGYVETVQQIEAVLNEVGLNT